MALFAVLLALILLASPGAAAPREDAYIACVIGQSAVALKNLAISGRTSDLDADTATDRAMTQAGRRCKTGGIDIGEGGGDYVYHSVRAIARQMFPE
jgi:hypothetical protein